ncbi:lipopolysaccharide biosynthesis protein [Flavobacterium sp. MDT1-60]|uniref:lipopolysaccharide biosynthesis protein n=1 Tax=Flavobacterium sp. MDT1-60 TaxID=1979344 RepID=UPI001784CAA3|nr:polysaccharide biosynthesis C-terminal domain-containing protein [Flavobacterium sp. MDT1-60]QOG04122.1 polysaccharide biosynthesis C-terminal domain-containing protein [Flavobacterium sp. MDT1-60]
MSKYKQLGKNTALVFIGNIGSKMIAFLMLPFYTKWLSVEDYGTSDNALIYVSLLIGIVTLSISESIFIFPKDQDFKVQKRFFTSGLVYSGLLLIITGFVLYGVRGLLLKGNLLKSITDNMGYIYLLVVSLFFQTFLQQFSRSINSIKVYAISGVVLTLLTTILSLILIPEYKLDGFFIAQILSFLISAAYTLVHSKSYQYFSLKELNFEKYGEMAKYSIPLIPNAIMWWLVGSLNRPLMEEYLGMHAIGLFAVSNKFPSLINVLFSVFMVSWQISVIEEYKKENYKEFYNHIFKLVFAFLLLCVMMISVLSKTLTGLVADAKFIESWKYIPILSLSVLFSSISGFVGCNFSATRESRYYFYSSVWGAVIAVVFNLILIPIWGLYGAVTAIVFSHLIMALSRIIYSWKIVKIEKIHLYLLMLVICLAVVLVSSFIQNNFIIIITMFTGFILLGLLMKKDVVLGLQMIKLKLKNNNEFK